jgi:hypothetical protein
MSGIQLLFEGNDCYWIRYSHSAADTDFDSELASQAVTVRRRLPGLLNLSGYLAWEHSDRNNRVGLHRRGVRPESTASIGSPESWPAI